MKTLFVLCPFLISCASAPTTNRNNCLHTQSSFKCVQYVKNYDADTITFNISNTHPLFGERINIRVNGVDTPEMRTKDKCEKKLALKAKELVGNLLREANQIDLENVKRGKYFRVVADVKIDGVNLGDYLIKNKLAYQYDGGTKSKVDWCVFELKSTNTGSPNLYSTYSYGSLIEN